MLKRMILGAFAYLVLTFPFAFAWHLIIFKSTYDALGFVGRKAPIVPLGALAIAMEGVVLAIAFPCFRIPGGAFRRGLAFGLMVALFHGAGHVFATAAKQPIEPLPTFFIIEWTYLLIQFSVIGIAFGFIYGTAPATTPIVAKG